MKRVLARILLLTCFFIILFTKLSLADCDCGSYTCFNVNLNQYSGAEYIESWDGYFGVCSNYECNSINEGSIITCGKFSPYCASQQVVCTYAGARDKFSPVPPEWGWWVLGDIAIEDDNLECIDNHDNDQNGFCDYTGCCDNQAIQSYCEGHIGGIYEKTVEDCCLAMEVNWLPKEPNCACNSSFTEICGDGYDNNCNNRIDCVLGKEDPSCNCPTCDTVESSANNNCDDGIDNDCDGNISIPCGNPGSSCDCADIGCAMDSVCTGCDDNDLDGYSTNGGSCGLIDCDDDITNDPGGICPSNSASCNTATSKCAICTHPGANEVCTDGIDNNCNNECDYDSSICVKGDIACKVDLANITVSNYFPLENTNFRLICNTGSSASGTEVNSIYAKVDNTFCTFNNFLSQNSYNFTCNAGSYATGNKSATCYVNTSKSYSNFNITSAQIDVQQTCTPNCNGKDCGDDGCSPYNEQDCGTCISGEQCINFQCLDNSECNIALVSWNKNSTLNGSIVNLFLFGTDLCSGKTISFDIYEDNDSKHITEIGGEDPEDVIYGIYGRGIWEARYLTEESDLKNEFFFKATINGTTYESGTGYNAVKWLNVNSACINIMTCDNYTDQESCEDNCGGSDVLDRSALEVYGQQCGIEYCLADRWVSNCQCKWENNKCVFYGEDTDCTGNNVTGWCKKTQGTVIGCDDENNPTPGYYTSSWSGIIMFLHSGWNTKNGCQTANNDFVEGHCANTSATSQIDGKWYYYPRGVDSCEEGGTSTIECPAEMNLPFFGAYNFVITIMVISIIYFLLTRKRKI